MIVAWLANSAAVKKSQMKITASVAGIKPFTGRNWMAPNGATIAVATSTTATIASVNRRCCAVGVSVANETLDASHIVRVAIYAARQHMPRNDFMLV